MAEIFISYRRQDSPKAANDLYDNLVAAFGADQVFKDVDAIRPGSDFRAVLDAALASCTVALVVIGLHWLEARDPHGMRRLDDPTDVVRIEIETLLRRNTILIPILLDGVSMPVHTQLPEALAPLLNAQAQSLRPETWEANVKSLIASISPPVKRRHALNYPRLMQVYAFGFVAAVAGLVVTGMHPQVPYVPWPIFGTLIIVGCWVYALAKAVQLNATVWIIALVAGLAAGPSIVLLVPIFAFRGPLSRQRAPSAT